jgi:hypothetical protein
MTSPLFEPPALCGPLRRPRQMLAEQRYDGHKSIGLFAGQEIRLIRGPLFVDHPYDLEREVIALSESPRTESGDAASCRTAVAVDAMVCDRY